MGFFITYRMTKRELDAAIKRIFVLNRLETHEKKRMIAADFLAIYTVNESNIADFRSGNYVNSKHRELEMQMILLFHEDKDVLHQIELYKSTPMNFHKYITNLEKSIRDSLSKEYKKIKQNEI